MTTEVIRLKLPAALKKRFEKDWTEGMKQPADVEVACGLADVTGSLLHWEITYTGQKTHQTKVKAYLRKVAGLPMTEQQYIRLLRTVRDLDMSRLVNQLIALAQRAFPANPDFWLIPAVFQLEEGPSGFNPWRVEVLLREADQKAQALPHDARREDALARIHGAQEQLNLMNPMRDFFDGIPDFFGDDWEEDDFDDD
jgi:hypothetical protein